jgi:hypothetical protein
MHAMIKADTRSVQPGARHRNGLNVAPSSTPMQPDVRKRLESQRSEVAGRTPGVSGMWIRDESENRSRIIRGLQLDLD